MSPVKAETGENRPLQAVNSEHLELRAGSGLPAQIPIDVGVRDGASIGSGAEKVPENAGDVPVRNAPDGAGPDPVRSPILLHSLAVCYVDTDVGADSRHDVLSRLFTRILSPVVCDCASVSSWAISFTSHGLG